MTTPAAAGIARRQLLAACTGLAGTTLACPALAQQARWPDRPIRFLQGFAAGGTTDIVARIIAPALSEKLGQPVVVENRPGAGGTLAAETLARSRPDGHTLMLINNGYAVAAALYRRLPYDPLTEVEPVAMVATIGLVVLAGTGPDAPRDLKELVARARANPDKVNVATVGVGSTQHFVSEALQAAAGMQMVHIPYRGTPAALVALRNGEVQVVMETGSAVLGQIRGGEARALAITSRERSPLLPDVPTVAEVLGGDASGFDIQTWYAVATPAGTPPEVVARLDAVTREVLAQPELRTRLADLGLAPRSLAGPPAVKAAVHAEISRWAAVIERAKIERQ